MHARRSLPRFSVHIFGIVGKDATKLSVAAVRLGVGSVVLGVIGILPRPRAP